MENLTREQIIEELSQIQHKENRFISITEEHLQNIMELHRAVLEN